MAWTSEVWGPRSAWSAHTVPGGDFATLAKAVARSKKTTRKSSFLAIEGFAEYQSGKAAAIAGITVADRHFAVRFTAVFCPSLYGVFGVAMIPAHVFARYLGDTPDKSAIDDAAENLAPSVASGPFRFESWKKGERLDLARNERYFEGAPLLDGFSLKVVTDGSAYAALSRDTEINLALIEPKDADAAARRGLAVRAYPAASYTAFAWNLRTGTPALRDVRVRQALAYAIDVDGFIESTLFGMVTARSTSSERRGPRRRLRRSLARPRLAAPTRCCSSRLRARRRRDLRQEGTPLSLVLYTNAGNRRAGRFCRQPGAAAALRSEAEAGLENSRRCSSALGPARPRATDG